MSKMEVGVWQDQSGAEGFVLRQNMIVLFLIKRKVQSKCL